MGNSVLLVSGSPGSLDDKRAAVFKETTVPEIITSMVQRCVRHGRMEAFRKFQRCAAAYIKALDNAPAPASLTIS